MRFDAVLPMAIRANRRFPFPGHGRGTVNAPHISLHDVFMALPACRRNVLPEDLRVRVGRRVKVMRPVAIGANRGGGQFLFQERFAVNARGIRGHGRLFREIELSHLLLIFVADPAGLWNIQAINGRIGVPVIEKRVGFSVTAQATRGRSSQAHRFAVVR